MEASIGIMAYNEEANIRNLLKELLKQKLEFVNEIVVVNDGSTDRTAEIVKKLLKNKKIKLINLKRRGGKVRAINEFLKKAKSDIIILESADTIPEKNAIKNLITDFKNPKTGIIGAHITPLNKNKGFANFFGNFIYQLHHEIALKNPKFGELIAFRNVIKEMPITAVDEECLAMLIKEKGYQPVYCPEAIVYNKQPDSIKELIVQRRRIHAGHRTLSKKGYSPATYKLKNITIALSKNLKFKEIHLVLGAILFESYVRWLGFYDTYLKRENHYIWKMAKSTKRLV